MPIHREHFAHQLKALIGLARVSGLMIRAVHLARYAILNSNQGVTPNGALHALGFEIIITFVYIICKKHRILSLRCFHYKQFLVI